jgi:WS/DGAT/MGAT family acyltransferase
MWFLPGLPDGNVGMFVRMHHVVADGVAGIAGLAAMLDGPSDADAQAPGTWTPAPEPARWELLGDDLRRRARALGAAIAASRRPRAGLEAVVDVGRATRDLVSGEPGPVTSLGGLVGPHRRLEFVRASLDDVEAVARATGATVNDVLLAMICAGVRALLANRGEPVNHLLLPIFVPVSLRRGEVGTTLGNRISQMRVELPVGVDDPVERLHRITAATATAKGRAHPAMGAVFRNRILSGVVLRLIIRKRVNLLSADIVGPRQPLSFAGVPVLEVFPLLNLMGNITLGVGALSYAGGFDVLAEGDANVYPDLDVFAAAAADEVRVLGAGSGPFLDAMPHQGGAQRVHTPGRAR